MNKIARTKLSLVKIAGELEEQGLVEEAADAMDVLKKVDDVEYPPDVKFWKGESLDELGWKKYTSTYSFNENMPSLFVVSPDRKNVFRWNNNFHSWELERSMDFETLRNSPEDFKEV